MNEGKEWMNEGWKHLLLLIQQLKHVLHVDERLLYHPVVGERECICSEVDRPQANMQKITLRRIDNSNICK